MTGSQSTVCGLLFLLLFSLSPVLGQAPETDSRPNAPLVPMASVPAPDPLPASSSRLPAVDLTYDLLTGPIMRPHFDNVHVVYGGELTLDADQADADLTKKRYRVQGHVRAHETDTNVQAAAILFDGFAQSAVATSARLTQKIYTIRSPRIVVTPALITAYDGDLTTAPPDERADYHLRAQTITLDSLHHRAVLRNVTLYLLGARLLTLPRLTFHLGGGGGATHRQAIFPLVAVSARYGTFIAYSSSLTVARLPIRYQVLLPTRQSVEGSIRSQQILYSQRLPSPPQSPGSRAVPQGPVTLLDKIRALATAPPDRLPEGDPLRFRDFLPEPNPIHLYDVASTGGVGLSEEIAVHIASQGRRRDDLYVTRLPEVTLGCQWPLTRLPAPPVYGDPVAFRNSMRHFVLYAQAQETLGNYREQPTNTRARRVQTQIGLSARPLLIAPNTVLLPSISLSTSGYSGSKAAYRYDQISVALNHYFTDLTAVGVQFLASNTSGDSPFNFDVLDTTRELDVRLQLGGRHLVTAGRVRLDLARSGVIDYQLTLAPVMHGFIPVFSYNFRTRSIGLGFEVKGLTF